MTTENGAPPRDMQIAHVRAPNGTLCYLKTAPLGEDVTLAAERDRLVWAASRVSVPAVIDYGLNDEGEWLLTAGLRANPLLFFDGQARVQRQRGGAQARRRRRLADRLLERRLQLRRHRSGLAQHLQRRHPRLLGRLGVHHQPLHTG